MTLEWFKEDMNKNFARTKIQLTEQLAKYAAKLYRHEVKFMEIQKQPIEICNREKRSNLRIRGVSESMELRGKN